MTPASWLAMMTAATLLTSCRSAPDSSGGASAPPPVQIAAAVEPPEAKRIPHRLESHGTVRIDDYYWMRERSDPAVIAHLEAENAYTAAKLRHTEPLQKQIFDEIVARIPQSDQSVPVREAGFFWYQRFEPGREYPIYARRKGSLQSPEEILLDVNELAKGHAYYSVPGVVPNDDGSIIGFAVDTVGRRKYDIHFKDLRSGEVLPDVLDDVTANMAWAADGKTVFYTRQDSDTLRWFQIWRHTLGTSPASDVLVYEEEDEEFSSYVYRSKSKKYVFIHSSQTVADESRVIDASNPTAQPRLLQARDRGREYSVDHLRDHFYIRTNDGGRNFRLMSAPDSRGDRQSWSEVVPHRENVYLEGFELFNDWLVLEERSEGLIRLDVRRWDGGERHSIDFGEPAYVAGLQANPDPDTDVVRYVYSSLTTPRTTYDYDMRTREKTLLKRDEVGGGYDPADYVTERLWAPARDGKRIPVSLVYRKGFVKNGTAPLLLYGYGSYGASMDAAFSFTIPSLLDRGFVYAIAHIRGGQELGRDWYEEGRLLKKKNTFTDFIDAAEFLLTQGYASRDRLFASGGSAGGLLVGAVMNMRPDLWRGVVARVPFVDVITTMLDESIPLTTSEYDEWGNPNDKRYYDYMLSYSPYDQVAPAAYPNLLITTGLHDSQVQYWEPAKWLARLRAVNTADTILLMKTDMEAGHSGTTGRFKKHEETAMIYAFLVDLAKEQ